MKPNYQHSKTYEQYVTRTLQKKYARDVLLAVAIFATGTCLLFSVFVFVWVSL